LFLRLNSTLSQYTHKARHKARYSDKARRFVREHARISVAVAAAATAAAGIGVASTVAGSAPQAEVTASAVTANYIGYRTPAGQAGGTIVRSVFGVHPESAGNQVTAASQQQELAQREPAQQQAPSKRQALSKPQTPPQPYLIYDSTVPYAVPAGQPVATYVDGPFAVPASEVAGHDQVLWIDTNGSDPQASALDVEPGDATPAIAAQWADQRLTEQPKSSAIIYTTLAEWPEVQAAISTLPPSMQSHVKYWVADPDGIPHMIPGASATQWYWGSSYDISTAEPGF
jgi:hypothetical protein